MQQQRHRRRSITELHEISVKFNAKQLKPQLPHFRTALGVQDNPAYYGILLDSVLGIVPHKAGGDPDGPELGVIVVAGYQVVSLNKFPFACERFLTGDVLSDPFD